MRWAVEISELSSNRRLLEDVLGVLSIRVLEENGQFLLESDHFEKLTTPSEVHAYASRIRAIAEEVKKHNPEVDCVFSVGTVVERSPDGIRRHHFLVVSSTVHIHCSGHAAVIRVEPTQHTSEQRAQREFEVQERKHAKLRERAVARIISAVRHEHALTVQQLLQEEVTPQVLGHIVDIIQDDMGGGLSTLMSETQKSRFYRSINHPKVFGRDARHIVSNQEPPPNPMQLGEARAFVQTVAEKWLAMKASDPSVT
jgi:hypothetical protein